MQRGAPDQPRDGLLGAWALQVCVLAPLLEVVATEFSLDGLIGPAVPLVSGHPKAPPVDESGLCWMWCGLRSALAGLMQLIGSDRGDLAAPFSLRLALHILDPAVRRAVLPRDFPGAVCSWRKRTTSPPMN
jgi:hypothetical protein